MHEIGLPFYEYFDKVYGCWLGKNAGGTLGAPLERIFAKKDRFNIDWYPELKKGGIPNDDLEVQLVLLKTLKEKGPNITSVDLAKAWLKHIQYNYDEYGLHKTNLRLGLFPPLSGNFNNWFKDCMGCPIRSEIWACIAPGHPEIAANYAYQDAVCDHAGGESVYGEVFNAVLESMAFFLTDCVKLVELSLKSIPKTSKTHLAIKSVLNDYNTGKPWEEAREILISQLYSPIAQYSPINLGFQTIGLLYGKTFGEAICIAVNCGWDTDCTGATVGAMWGIIHGKKRLPDKWLEPLGDSVVVSRGIKNLIFPKNLQSLTQETCALGKQVVDYWNPLDSMDYQEESEYIDIFEKKLEKIQKLWDLPVNFTPIPLDGWGIEVKIYFPKGPGIHPDKELPLRLWIKNQSEETFTGTWRISVPDEWVISIPDPLPITIAKEEILDELLTIQVPKCAFGNFSTPKLKIETGINKKEWEGQIPVISAHCWQVSNTFALEGHYKKPSPEKTKRSLSPGSGWISVTWVGNDLPIEPYFKTSPGIIYLRHFIHSNSKQVARLGVPNNSRMTLWLNGRKIKHTVKIVPLRPNYAGDGSNYARAKLKKGWNVVMIKLVREDYPLTVHFTLADNIWANGLVDVTRHKFPWE